MTKKEKILDSAVQYFNKEGYGGASLFQLAQEIGMSRGNLTYHFKTKENLLEAIVKQMWEKLDVARTKSKEFPSFENLQNEIKLFQQFQEEYGFVFLDPQVFLNPEVKTQLKKFRKDTIKNSMTTIFFSIRIGNMKKEEIPGSYLNICTMLWMISFYWISQQAYLEKKNETTWDKIMWSMLLPHFTEKGNNAFKAFFGEEYFQSLGEPFDVCFNEINTF